MKVVAEGEISRQEPVMFGVLQETVLGSLFFLCLINGPSDSVASQVRLLADDCLIYIVELELRTTP